MKIKYVRLLLIGLLLVLGVQVTSALSYPEGMLDINLYRRANGLSYVIYSPRLCKIAEVRVQEEKDVFNHDHLTAVIASIPGNPYGLYHENLAKGYRSFATVMYAWKRSPAHNAVLLGPMTEACVSRDGGYWALAGFNYMKK